MTHQDESAPADADRIMPSTRRSRREGEREAQHRALYAEAPQASSVRVVDGGSLIYRTRREMRESASRLARDLPVIVTPTTDSSSDAAAAVARASVEETGGRRARRAADAASQASHASAPLAPSEAERAQPEAAVAEAPTSRRARRIADASVPPSVRDEAPTIPSPESTTVAPSTRRARRAAASAPAEPVVASQLPATLDEEHSGVGLDEAPATTRVEVERATIEQRPIASDELPPTSTSESQPERAMTRAERRAARAASSDEVSAAVAAVLGGEQDDAASTPVRSPLRREARPPRPAVVARRPVVHAPVVRPSRRARTSAARTAIQRLGAAGVILTIGGLVAVTSLPAQAFSPPDTTTTTGAYGDVDVEQELDVTSGSGAHGDDEVTAVLTRDDFGVDDALASARMSPEEMASLQAVADAEEIGPYYGGEPAMPGVWAQLETTYTQSPFPSLAEVPVSSGFGYRWGSFHGGVDLVPGAGTPVYPIANGVVVATWQGNNPGGGGYEVIVEHNVDGQYFQSWYPHMQAGSIQVEPGQVVDITTQLGNVGSTGHSTGPHLHLEIKNGDYISVDPLVWLATREQILEP
ncbi:M23 family metallopeptidase [Agrococcus sp. SGAir0287]|uniref:M23 family metallopeptidase n=1 Tax=Agrococcus sp. SGAir0287 TaxID=2070347 RepID=UPI0010CD501A|nr:peptidoglycan DD-metalloendopeptidase family protein [Agrococcus sp. SGAir0287]QCR18512.1 hypothetical protein C1N71_02810 [Agrococcus sp. SGAir0287]